MARQRVHNRRAGRGSSGGGASWISYSDMMAALLLMFVLILSLSLNQYFIMLDTKQAELDKQSALLDTQQTALDEQASLLSIQQAELDEKSAALIVVQTDLATREEELANANTALATREAELAALQIALGDKQKALDAATQTLKEQQAALDAQTSKIDDLVGVRTKIIQDLSSALSANSLSAMVDPQTGDILLDSAVFFETNSDKIRSDGQALLDRFIPVYLGVLLQPQYQDYLGEIIIEGHTDTTGSYMNNLKLSQNRALSVASYCLEMPSLSQSQRNLLRSILTATGRSFSDPVYNADGTVNMDASRRVEFKFSLKDAEMIDEMNRLLQGGSQEQ